MTLDELWLKIATYPDRLETFNRNTNGWYIIRNTWKMEDFVDKNGDLIVVYFEVSFDPSYLHVELEQRKKQ